MEQWLPLDAPSSVRIRGPHANRYSFRRRLHKVLRWEKCEVRRELNFAPHASLLVAGIIQNDVPFWFGHACKAAVAIGLRHKYSINEFAEFRTAWNPAVRNGEESARKASSLGSTVTMPSSTTQGEQAAQGSIQVGSPWPKFRDPLS